MPYPWNSNDILTAGDLNDAFAVRLPTSVVAGTNGNCNGIMIPWYIYPNNPYSDATSLALLAMIRRYHDVPIILVVNPSSGPGTVVDGNYAAFIKLARAAGAVVCGYVSTGYAGTIDVTKTEAVVKADILKWNTLYADTPVDGIFLDEMPYATGTANAYVELYARYYTYAHANGYNTVIGNPGTNEQEAWYATRTADIVVTWETSTWISEADVAGAYSGGHGDYSWQLEAVLVHTQTVMDPATFNIIRKYAKWLYITDDVFTCPTADNPWDSVSTYLEQIFRLCRNPQDGYLRNVPVTTFNFTISAPFTVFEPAGTLALGTVTFPAAPFDRQVVGFSFTKIITGLTLTGGTFPYLPTTAAAGQVFRFIYLADQAKWYPC